MANTWERFHTTQPSLGHACYPRKKNNRFCTGLTVTALGFLTEYIRLTVSCYKGLLTSPNINREPNSAIHPHGLMKFQSLYSGQYKGYWTWSVQKAHAQAFLQEKASCCCCSENRLRPTNTLESHTNGGLIKIFTNIHNCLIAHICVWTNSPFPITSSLSATNRGVIKVNK